MTDGYLDFEEMLREEKLKEDALLPEMPHEADIKIIDTRYPNMPDDSEIDTRSVMADLKAMEIKGMDLVNKANALQIKTAKDNENAVNISGKLQEIGKQVKKKCEDFLEPYKKTTAEVNAPKKRITEAVTSAKKIVNQKIMQYGKQAEIERIKQQQLIDKASEELQDDLNSQAKELGIEAPKVAPIKAPGPARVLRSGSGASVYTRKVWTYEITDPKKVPRELCSPDTKKINDAVRIGKRNISGIKIFEKEAIVTRA